ILNQWSKDMNKMTHEQFLIQKLAEEASEIAQIALKTSQFGMTEKHPEMELNNKERTHLEINDLLAVVDELNTWCGFGYKPDYASKINKIEKINKYLGYSIQLGKVENVPAIFGESDHEFTTKQIVENDDWTHVEKKEPDLGETVLVCWDYMPDVEPEMDFMESDVDTGNHYWANCEKEPPTHWMAIPSVPRLEVKSND
ncbi:hypothetical protein, partial [Acinetobacter bereziniae]|uniref:hypothetical protein n=1 Tax=Acinetobacter bereziniae TaxID=106648 RepID=UPI001D18B9BD